MSVRGLQKFVAQITLKVSFSFFSSIQVTGYKLDMGECVFSFSLNMLISHDLDFLILVSLSKINILNACLEEAERRQAFQQEEADRLGQIIALQGVYGDLPLQSSCSRACYSAQTLRARVNFLQSAITEETAELYRLRQERN